MVKNKKSVLALLLTLIMVMAMVPTSAFAAEAGNKVTRNISLKFRDISEITDTNGDPVQANANGEYDMLDTEGWKWVPKNNGADGGVLTLNGCNVITDSVQEAHAHSLSVQGNNFAG